MSLLLIILLSPLFLIISVIILFDAGSPVIFKQYRVGKDNKLFYVYKFRSMRVDAEKKIFLKAIVLDHLADVCILVIDDHRPEDKARRSF